MQAKTKDLLEFEYNEVNNHLERLFIITNSIKILINNLDSLYK